MHKLVIKPFAEEDIKDAFIWYNEKREGLGNDFLLALEATLNIIQRSPNKYQVVYKTLKRALTFRFPYGVFFIVKGDTIFVLAIIHTSRNPKIWKNR